MLKPVLYCAVGPPWMRRIVGSRWPAWRLGRQRDEGVDLGAVGAGGLDALRPSEADPFQELVVDVVRRRSAPGPPPYRRDLGGTLRSAFEHRQSPLGPMAKALDGALAVHRPLDRPAGGRDAGQVVVAPLLQEEVDELAVQGETRIVDVAVQLPGQRPGLAAGDRDHGDVVGGVPDVLGIAPGEIGDPLAVRAEGRGPVGTGELGEGARSLPLLGRVRLHQVDVAVVVGIRIGVRLLVKAIQRPSGTRPAPGRRRLPR